MAPAAAAAAAVSPLRLPLADRQKQFKPGSIRRIKLKNFLTYADVEVHLGSRLNVVIGPNGTGKSTILCAICLGLGGQPPLLGRADDARTFIMHEKDIATIEIELAPFPDKPTHIIRRTIDRNKGSNSRQAKGKAASTYEINGQEVKVDQVSKLVSDTYKIAIENLCTFLPQDRVGSFSGFDSKQLLEETEKSVGGDLHAKHMELVKLENEYLNSDGELKNIEDELERLKSEVKELERQRDLMEERKDMEEKLDLYKKKMLWMDFEEARDVAKEFKSEKKAAQKQLTEAENGMGPLNEQLQAINGEIRRGHEQKIALEKDIEVKKKIYENSLQKVEKYNDDIDDKQQDLATIDSNKRKAEQDVKSCEQQLEHREAVLRDYPSLTEMKEKVAEKQSQVRVARKEVQNARSDLHQKTTVFKEAQHDLDMKQRRLAAMKDEKARRNERIFAGDQNLKDVYDYINSNRTMFRRPVHGPIVCEINTQDTKISNYLDQHVSGNVFRQFVVECREDQQLLYREVREKRGLRINVHLVQRGEVEEKPRMYSEQKMNRLKQKYGVVGYLDEFFSAPGPIMQALRNQSNVQSVLVGGPHTKLSDELSDYLFQREDGSGFQSFCIFAKKNERNSNGNSKDYKFTSGISRYRNDSTNIDVSEIVAAKMLSPGVPQEDKIRAENEVKNARKLIAELEPGKQEAFEKHNQLMDSAQKIQQEYKDAQIGLNEVKKHQENFERAQRKLQQAKELAAMDNKDEKKRTVQKIRKCMEQSIQEIKKATNAYDVYIDAVARHSGVKLSEDGLVAKRDLLIDQLDVMRRETEGLRGKVQELAKRFQHARERTLQLKEIADREAPLGTPDEPTEIKEALEKITNDKDELKDLIVEAKEVLETTVENYGAIRRYEEQKAALEIQQEKYDGLKDSKETRKKELDAKKQPYHSRLTNIITEVNELFEKYMTDLGCAGRVALYTGEETRGDEEKRENFKDWGIQIQVKFREKSQLQTLSAQVHSGGERSVSTIMYLMAMQDLMKSPFRCVDEINQGLDERNERLVFKRIVENSTRAPEDRSDPSSHCGQYFLITPKLLPNLTDMENEGVTVHCIFNGYENFDHYSDWNVDRLLEYRNESNGNSPVKRRRVK